MFSHYTYFDELVEKMLRGDYDQHMREAWVWIHGRFVPYPFQNNIHRLPPDVFLDCVMGIIESQRQRQAGQLRRVDPLRVRRRHRRALHAALQLQGVGPPARDDGHQWQGDRVPTSTSGGSSRTCSTTATTCSWGPNNMFKFPLLGTGMLYERIAEALPKPVQFHEGGGVDRHRRRRW